MCSDTNAEGVVDFVVVLLKLRLDMLRQSHHHRGRNSERLMKSRVVGAITSNPEPDPVKGNILEFVFLPENISRKPSSTSAYPHNVLHLKEIRICVSLERNGHIGIAKKVLD